MPDQPDVLAVLEAAGFRISELNETQRSWLRAMSQAELATLLAAKARLDRAAGGGTSHGVGEDPARSEIGREGRL